jgi:sulfhydrogenase subunit gamma (sulfur reductase)
LPELPDSPFLPLRAGILETQDLTPDVKLFRVEIEDPRARASFRHRPGQFAFLSAFGTGESPFTFAGYPSPDGVLEFAIRRVGTVTAALHELEPGDAVGVRGPFGNTFPLEEYRGKSIIIIGGGIGLAPLRPVIQAVLNNRGDYGELLVIYGARTPADLVFAHEFPSWAEAPRTRVELTVDRGDGSWQGRVALVPTVLKELKPSPENAITITCGPPIMIRFVLAELKALNFAPGQIVTTLESKMKCGLGKCARCNIGEKYVCQDGPVFSFSEISRFLEQV